MSIKQWKLGVDLASSPLSGVRRIRKSLTLLVNREHQRTGFTSLEEKFYHFEPSLGGVLMACDGLTVLGRTERNSLDLNIHVTVRANFYVFYPAVGQYLSVRIMKMQADSAMAVVNKHFLMVINKAVAGRYEVGQVIIVKVQAISYTSGVPTLVGETVAGTRRQVMMEVESRKIQDLLETEDDELTGLEVVEVAGKGRGVRAVRMFSRGDPVVEYVGILSNLGRSGVKTRDRAREEETAFSFFFHNAGNKYKIDASQAGVSSHEFLIFP